MGNTIKFGRAVENDYGDSTWQSKCGRFEIKRWTFDFPSHSIEYRLTDKTTGLEHIGYMYLSDAKRAAQRIVDDWTRLV